MEQNKSIGKTGKNTVGSFLIRFLVPEISVFKKKYKLMAQKWFTYRRNFGEILERKAKFVTTLGLYVSRQIMESTITSELLVMMG